MVCLRALAVRIWNCKVVELCRKEFFGLRALTCVERDLVEKNHSLIYSFIAEKGLSAEEFYDLMALALCGAAVDFCGSEEEFPAFAVECMGQALYKEERKRRRKCVVPTQLIVSCESLFEGSGEGVLQMMPASEGIEDLVCAKQRLNSFVSGLEPASRKLLSLIALGCTQYEIANSLGVTQSRVSRLKNSVFEDLVKFLEVC